MRKPIHRMRAAAIGAIAGLALAACGDDRTAPPADTAIDTMGTNGEVGEIKVRNLYVEAPEGGNYQPGETATLRLRLVNESDQDDRLVAIRSAVAGSGRIQWDDDCDDDFDTVDALPVLRGSAPLTGAYFVELVGLDETVRAGTTVPVTLEFRHAGEGTIDAMVESRRDGEDELRPGCRPATE